jgi:uncharacterized protein (TIGR02996 family)
MTEHVPFLKAILDQPDGLGPRLVYADWLEENGETALAEYVRLGCEVDQTPPDDPRRHPMKKRMTELLRANRAAWLGPFAKRATNIQHITSENGFHTFRFTCTTPHFLSRLASGAGQPRLPHGWALETNDITQHLECFLSNPGLDWLTSLALSGAAQAGGQVGALLGCERLGNVRELQLGGVGVGDAGCRMLSSVRHWHKLDKLAIVADAVSEAGLHALLDSRRLSRLHYLRLSVNLFTGVVPPPVKLSSRHPRIGTLILAQNRVEDAGAGWLAGWPGLANVTWLDLGFAGIGPAGMAALARSPHFKRLTYLDLTGNRIGDEGARALAGAPFLSHLNYLKLDYANIGPAGGLALLAAPALPRNVSILDNPLGEARRRLTGRLLSFSS